MRMLVFSFAVGIVHLFVGLGIKFYQMAKDGDIKGAIYDVVFWYLFGGGRSGLSSYYGYVYKHGGAYF